MHTRTKGEGQISVAIIHFGQLIYRNVSGFLCLPFSFFSFSLITWVDMYVFIWRLHCCIMKQRVVAFSVRQPLSDLNSLLMVWPRLV